MLCQVIPVFNLKLNCQMASIVPFVCLLFSQLLAIIPVLSEHNSNPNITTFVDIVRNITDQLNDHKIGDKLKQNIDIKIVDQIVNNQSQSLRAFKANQYVSATEIVNNQNHHDHLFESEVSSDSVQTSDTLSPIMGEITNSTEMTKYENETNISSEETRDLGESENLDHTDSSDSIEDESAEESDTSLMNLLLKELNANSVGSEMTPNEKFVALIDKIKKLYNLVMKDLTPIVFEQILTINISVDCVSSLAKSYEALTKNRQWVLTMLDSNGHLPSGLMSGTLTSLGDYNQCLSVDSEDEHRVKGKYCLMKVRPELPPKKKVITFKDRFINVSETDLRNTWIERHVIKSLYNFYYFSVTNGICVPSACSTNDLVTLAKHVFTPLYLKVDVENCVTKNEGPTVLDFGQTLAILIILVFISCSVFGTALEFLGIGYSEESLKKIIECFSVRRNVSQLFDTSSVSSDSHRHNLQFLNGVKVLSIVWIIIGHTYISGAIFYNKDIPTANFYFANLVDTINLPRQLFTQFVINALLAVDTFFFISGFLLIYLSVIKVNQNHQKINFLVYILLRWIRFSPMLIAIISMNLLWPLIGSGPLFHENYIRFMTGPCYKYWWRNLLFISNWYPPDEQCMVHTWYMSADFQYYVIAFMVIKLACSNIKHGMIASSSLVVVGVVLPTLVAYIEHLPPTILYQADIENMALHTHLMHYKTYNHITPYFLGSFVACLLLSKHDFKINQVIQCLLWITTFLGSLFVVFVTYVWTALEWEYSRAGAAVYFGSHRFIWSAGLAWITFNCAYNRAGIINSILSSSSFKVTSRLTFSIYMSHMLIIWYNFFRTKHLFSSTHYDMLFNASGIFGFTFIFALINHILFEAPILNLVKYMMSSGSGKDKNCNELKAKTIINNLNDKIDFKKQLV